MDVEPATPGLELQKELDALRRDFESNTPPNVAETMARFSAELILSGIMDHALTLGAVAPDFALPNAVGRMVSLSATAARGPTVVTFYRGAW